MFSLNNITGQIYSKQYIPVRESYKLIGKRSNKDLKKGEIIHWSNVLQNQMGR